MKLSVLITDFLRFLEQERHTSAKTIENYNHYLQRFLQFAGDVEISALDLKLINDYQVYLQDWKDPKTHQGLKKVTQNYFLIALRAFFRFISQKGVTPLTAEDIKLSEVKSSPPPVLDETAVHKLLAAPDVLDPAGIRDKVLLEILFSTGLRVSEVADLNRDDFDLERQEIMVRRKGKSAPVTLPDTVSQWIERYLRVRDDSFKPLFIRFQGRIEATGDGEPMRLTTRSIQRIVEKYVKGLDLPVKATPQTLRHSFATGLLIKGKDLRTVQEILGHSHLSTTQMYTPLSKPIVKE